MKYLLALIFFAAISGCAFYNTSADELSDRAIGYAKKGQYDSALRYFKKAERIDPNSRAIALHISHTYQQLDEHESCVEYATKALNIDPFFIPALKKQATCLTKLERYDESITALEKLIQLNPNDYATLGYLAKTNSLNNNHGKFLEYYSLLESTLDKMDKDLLTDREKTTIRRMRAELLAIKNQGLQRGT